MDTEKLSEQLNIIGKLMQEDCNKEAEYLLNEIDTSDITDIDCLYKISLNKGTNYNIMACYDKAIFHLTAALELEVKMDSDIKAKAYISNIILRGRSYDRLLLPMMASRDYRKAIDLADSMGMLEDSKLRKQFKQLSNKITADYIKDKLKGYEK